jgi:hypothetical protein
MKLNNKIIRHGHTNIYNTRKSVTELLRDGHAGKDIKQEDCEKVGLGDLLVWRPSSQEVPGPSCVLSAPSP